MSEGTRKRRPANTLAPAAGVALVAVGAALWGVDAVFRQPLVSRWPSWTIVMCEHLILTAVCLPLLLSRRAQARRLDRLGWLSVLAVAWGGSALATLAFTQAFAYSPVSTIDSIVLLQKTQPLWAIAAAALTLGERPRPRLVMFVIPAAIGSYLLAFGTAAPGQVFASPQGRAAALALVAAALWGSATAFGRRAMRSVSFEFLTALRFTAALPLLIVIAGFEGAIVPPSSAAAGDYLRVLVIALVPGLVAMLLYYRGLRETPASVATFAE
ncbi:MAG TPA: DMT family transporter, partial [Gaiellales bacterium]|nr:DMT family transporter [Gaiellales bacterium]